MATLARILQRWRMLTGPAPLDDFADYDENWQRREPFRRVIRRWVIAADLRPEEGTLLDVGCASSLGSDCTLGIIERMQLPGAREPRCYALTSVLISTNPLIGTPGVVRSDE